MDDTKYIIKELSFDEMINDLNGTSPLKMSKKLMEYELTDQQSSMEVLNTIYEEFESRENLVNELVTPLFLNIADGLVSHPKLGLQKMGITTSRLVNEIKNFSYEENHSFKNDAIQDIMNTKINTLSPEYKRKNVVDTKKMKEYKDNYLKTRSRDEYTNQNKVAEKRPQPDHILSLSASVKEYGQSKFLSDANLKKTLNQDFNLAVTNGSLNQSKGDKSNTLAVSENKKTIASNQTEATKARMIKKEKEATKVVEQDLNNTVTQNLKDDIKNVTKGDSKLINDAKDQAAYKAIGEMVILLIKPIYYEFSDIFKNGMIGNLNVNDKIEAFICRMKRVKDYVLNNAVGSIFDNIKELLQSFVTMLINGIVNAFVGLVKKILQVIAQGFASIVESIKILAKDKDDAGNIITAAQKADAIVKLLATTAVTFLGSYFEESILGFMTGTPVEFLKDVIMVMLTGIASTVIVWLIDQADLFSVKDEKRMMRVKEIFELRIQTIKQNTDIFEKASIEVLAKQKLQFKKLASNMQNAIDKNMNVNDSVYEMANFMHIDLQAKSTDEFLNLLSKNKQLVI